MTAVLAVQVASELADWLGLAMMEGTADVAQLDEYRAAARRAHYMLADEYLPCQPADWSAEEDDPGSLYLSERRCHESPADYRDNQDW